MKLEVSSAGVSGDWDALVLVVTPADAEYLRIERNEKSDKKKPRARASIATRLFRELDVLCAGALLATLAKENFKAEANTTLTPCCLAVDPNKVVAVVGRGKDLSREESAFGPVGYYRALGSTIIDIGRKRRWQSVALVGANLDFNTGAHVTALCEGLELSCYSFRNYKGVAEEGKESAPPYVGPKKVELLLEKPSRIANQAWTFGQTLCAATAFARDLVNTPARDCTPGFLVKSARQIAQKSKLQIEVYDRPRLEKMRAGALLAVAQGSEEPPYLIKLTHRVPKPKKIIALVGKGVTFDSGGLSIKSAQGMESMKIDMSGAGAVLAAMSAISELNPKVEVRAYIPTTENMINGRATRPGDVVRGMSGTTIEILNTDAEGRLILSDALTLATQEKCDEIIDVATLTGACMVALGNDYAGLFATDDKLANALIEAGELEGERLWRMPLASEYRELIKSSIADIKNTGGAFGGAITAALFLKEFVGDTRWAHLDMCGPATVDSDKGFRRKGAVGFGVRTLVRYVLTTAGLKL